MTNNTSTVYLSSSQPAESDSHTVQPNAYKISIEIAIGTGGGEGCGRVGGKKEKRVLTCMQIV